MRYTRMVLIAVLCFGLAGCRGYRSDLPPVHPNPNLDWQAKYKAQTLATLPPEGTVPWGRRSGFEDASSRESLLKADSVYYEGKDADGQWVRRIPGDVTLRLVRHGQERFNIYCAACHDRSGSGKSMVVKRGFPPVPDLTTAYMRELEDGYLFDVITNGVRNMPAYGKTLSESDRWAIVAYLRALQLNQSARLQDVPAQFRDQIK